MGVPWTYSIASQLTYRRFCGQDEEHDPGEEYEEYLACSVCGDNCKCISRIMHEDEEKHAANSNIKIQKFRVHVLTFVPAAHRQCARDADTLAADEGT